MRAIDFHTKAKHDQGTKVFLDAPDGTKTEESVLLLGRDSESFRKGQARYRDRMISAKADGVEFDSLKEGIELTASAVVGWSLDEECTKAAVCDLLTNAPYILDKLDSELYDNKRFFTGQE